MIYSPGHRSSAALRSICGIFGPHSRQRRLPVERSTRAAGRPAAIARRGIAYSSKSSSISPPRASMNVVAAIIAATRRSIPPSRSAKRTANQAPDAAVQRRSQRICRGFLGALLTLGESSEGETACCGVSIASSGPSAAGTNPGLERDGSSSDRFSWPFVPRRSHCAIVAAHSGSTSPDARLHGSA